MSILSSIAKFGNKVAAGALKGLKFGEKVTGAADKYGHKLAHTAQQGVDMLSHVPGVGSSKIVSGARSAVGVVSSAADAAHSASGMVKAAEKGVRGVESAVHAGNAEQALHVLRTTAKDEFAAGKKLHSQARSTLERVKRA
eukprot:COSAG04_NODE_2482_length_4041_cov_4.531710_1_plen_141_part_00